MMGGDLGAHDPYKGREPYSSTINRQYTAVNIFGLSWADYSQLYEGPFEGLRQRSLISTTQLDVDPEV